MIGTAPTYSLDTTATVTNSTTSSPNIDFGTNFSNPDATGRKMSGSVHFTVYTNAQCNYVLTSTYGALKNITAGQTGTFRDYYADAYDHIRIRYAGSFEQSLIQYTCQPVHYPRARLVGS